MVARSTVRTNRRLLALLMHTLLWRHGICGLWHALALLLLKVGLILQGLRLVCGHTVRLRGSLITGHALRWHGLWHGRRGGVLLFG